MLIAFRSILSEVLLDPSLPTTDVPQVDYAAAVVKMCLTLIVLVALMGITVWFLRRLIHQRLQKNKGNQSIQILEKRMISAKTMLYLVEVESQKILLAESHLEIRRLHVLGEAPEATIGVTDATLSSSVRP